MDRTGSIRNNHQTASKDLPGRKFFNIFFIITMYFGGGLIPTYLVVRQTGLMNNMWALFIPGGVAVGNMIIVRNIYLCVM